MFKFPIRRKYPNSKFLSRLLNFQILLELSIFDFPNFQILDLLINVAIRCNSSLSSYIRVKRRKSWRTIGIGIEKTGEEEARDRLEGGNCTRCIGARVFYTACDRRRLSARRERLSDDVSTPFSVLSPFRVLSLSSRAFFLSPLIRRCISSFLFFFFFLFSGFLLFIPVRFMFVWKRRWFAVFEDEAFRIGEL